MSAGSGASNLGYGKMFPFSNVNTENANVYNMHNPANFGSKVIPGPPGLAGTKDNVAAAAGKWPGPNIFKGGAKGLKRKIKNITRKYKKMRHGSKKRKSMKNRIRRNISRQIAGTKSRQIAGARSRTISRAIAGGPKSRQIARSRSRAIAGGQRGGYAQYQNNMPLTPSYSTGGILKPTESALANPVPFKVIGGNCVDNYNHYTNKGFPSTGH
jgi:hypothetical protein